MTSAASPGGSASTRAVLFGVSGHLGCLGSSELPAPIGHLLGARVRWSAPVLAALSVETRRSEARPTPEWPFSCRVFSAVQLLVTRAEQLAPGSRCSLTSTSVESGRRESNSRSQLGKLTKLML